MDELARLNGMLEERLQAVYGRIAKLEALTTRQSAALQQRDAGRRAKPSKRRRMVAKVAKAAQDAQGAGPTAAGHAKDPAGQGNPDVALPSQAATPTHADYPIPADSPSPADTPELCAVPLHSAIDAGPAPESTTRKALAPRQAAPSLPPTSPVSAADGDSPRADAPAPVPCTRRTPFNPGTTLAAKACNVLRVLVHAARSFWARLVKAVGCTLDSTMFAPSDAARRA